jgi:hypothetical protein
VNLDTLDRAAAASTLEQKSAEQLTRELEESGRKMHAKQTKQALADKLANDPKHLEDRKKKVEAEAKARKEQEAQDIVKDRLSRRINMFELYRGPNMIDYGRTESAKERFFKCQIKKNGVVDWIATEQAVYKMMDEQQYQ